jgi:hypothetical protein
MARDEANRYVNLSIQNDTGEGGLGNGPGGLELIYDRFAELMGTKALGYAKGGPLLRTPSEGGSSNEKYRSEWGMNNSIALESVAFSSLMLDRYQYPKLIARGNSTTTAGASVYLLYYDDNGRNLIFRNLKIAKSNIGKQLHSGSTSSTNDAYAQYTNFDEATSDSGGGRITAASAASRYFDMAVTSDDKVVIVYYDEEAGRLKLRYSKTAVTGANPTADPGWTNSPVDLPADTGAYVSMAIDGAKGLHIAAFDAGGLDLKYIYVPNHEANSNVKVVTVDQFGSVGNWTQIKLNGGTPYIAYYNATEAGSRDSIKLAWAKNTVVSAGDVHPGVDENGYTTGKWEYMTVPALTPPQGGSTKFKQVNLGFRSDDRPVLGYLGTKIEFSYWVNE